MEHGVNEFLLVAVTVVLATMALGLVRILRGPGDADRMMAAQLLGTGGIAGLLLAGAVTGAEAAVDVALTLALLSAFASIALVKKGVASLETDSPGTGTGTVDRR
jgi:multicomponent Na+:H+ antiporter subunit F